MARHRSWLYDDGMDRSWLYDDGMALAEAEKFLNVGRMLKIL